MKHFISLADYSSAELQGIVDAAIKMKQEGRFGDWMKNKMLMMVFFNSSLRTRASFQAGMSEMGGDSVCLDIGQGVWGMEWRDGVVMDGVPAEHLKESVPVLGRYGQLLAVRSFPQLKSWADDREDPVMSAFAEYSSVPVVNMESALYHPCQGLGDMMTVTEKMGSPKGRKIVVTWADHPKVLPMAVPNSAVTGAAKFGMNVTLACPEGYELAPEITEKAKTVAEENGGSFSVTHDMKAGAEGADVVYAKSWGSLKNYGNHDKELSERENLKHWIVDESLMAKTNNAYFMHCLPVRRNVVVSDGVIDSDRSIVIDQAENRLHIQKAILRFMLEK